MCTPHSVKYNEIEEAVVNELKNMCQKYVDSNSLEDNLRKTNKITLLIYIEGSKISCFHYNYLC